MEQRIVGCYLFQNLRITGNAKEYRKVGFEIKSEISKTHNGLLTILRGLKDVVQEAVRWIFFTK